MTEFWQYGAAVAVILLAYFIRGIAGFGSGLIAVPLLALFLPLTFVVPLILLLDFTASLVMGGLDLKRVQWREVGMLIPFSLMGVIVGTQLLVNLPLTPMLLTLAAFIAVFAVRSLLNLKGEKPVSRVVGNSCFVDGRHGGRAVWHGRAAVCDLFEPPHPR